MSENAQAAELLTDEAVKMISELIKLAEEGTVFIGGKALAALIALYQNRDKNPQGVVSVAKLAKRDPNLAMFSMDQKDFAQFKDYAAQFQLAYCPFRNAEPGDGPVDIMVSGQDRGRVNYIFEKLGLPAPALESEEPGKNEPARDPHDRESRERGNGSPSPERGNTTTEQSAANPFARRLAQVEEPPEPGHDAPDQERDAPEPERAPGDPDAQERGRGEPDADRESPDRDAPDRDRENPVRERVPRAAGSSERGQENPAPQRRGDTDGRQSVKEKVQTHKAALATQRRQKQRKPPER